MIREEDSLCIGCATSVDIGKLRNKGSSRRGPNSAKARPRNSPILCAAARAASSRYGLEKAVSNDDLLTQTRISRSTGIHRCDDQQCSQDLRSDRVWFDRGVAQRLSDIRFDRSPCGRCRIRDAHHDRATFDSSATDYRCDRHCVTQGPLRLALCIIIVRFTVGGDTAVERPTTALPPELYS